MIQPGGYVLYVAPPGMTVWSAAIGMTMFDRAVETLHLAEADPARSVPLASALVRLARRQGDPATASMAERALGIAALHLRDSDAAARHLRAAVTLGRQAGQPGLVAAARLRLAAVMNVRGRPRRALREIDAALRDFDGIDRARAYAQRGAILLQLGHLDEALRSFESALPALRAADDHMWLKRVLANRGLVYGRRLQFAAATADLLEAERLNRELGLDLSVAFIQQNMGWVDTLRGDVPRALEYLDAAEGCLRRLGAQVGFLLEDRAALLLSVGLVSEAREAAEQAVQALERERQRIGLPDVRLLLARAAMLDGDPAGALAQARRAVRELSQQGRPQWTTMARFVVLTCRAAGPDRRGLSPGRFARLAGELDAAGWPAAAIEARLLAAQLTARPHQAGQVRDGLRRASTSRRRGPASLRALGWHAEALLRLGEGNRAGAARALGAGLRVLDEHRASLGATDLRAHTGRQRAELAVLGLRTAVHSGRPLDVLTWAEHGRASHLLLPPVTPPADDQLAADLAELRSIAARSGETRPAGADPSGTTRRQVALERRIRDRSRRQPGTPGPPATRPVRAAALTEALGERALVEYIDIDNTLHAVTFVDGRARLHPLGAADPVGELIDRLPFALLRLAQGRSGAAGQAATSRLLHDAASRLDAALLAPLRRHIGDRCLVLVPTGRLQSMPWSLLPSCTGRPVTVAPSATTWYAAGTGTGRATGAGAGAAVVVAGPGLPGARAEAAAVASIHGTDALVGPAATVDAVLVRLTGARVAHLAAHGQVHRDNPLFSALLLADGPLTGYDLERLRPVPELVVLAACEGGRHAVYAGDELLGLTATLLARGARQVVASVVPVPDAETAPLMTAFHELLVTGVSAAEALAGAQRRVDGAAAVAAAAGFVCIGGTFALAPRGSEAV